MKPKQPRNPAAQPRGILRVDPDAYDRDPIHGCTLVHSSKAFRELGVELRFRSTASGWTTISETAPQQGVILAEGISFNDTRILLDALWHVAVRVRNNVRDSFSEHLAKYEGALAKIGDVVLKVAQEAAR